MKCHAGVEFPSGKDCPKCGARLGEVCWPGINNDLLELAKLRKENEQLRVAVEGANLNVIARALYAKWCHEADHEPDWSAYDKHHSVNPAGLSQYDFIEEAKALLASFPSTRKTSEVSNG